MGVMTAAALVLRERGMLFHVLYRILRLGMTTCAKLGSRFHEQPLIGRRMREMTSQATLFAGHGLVRSTEFLPLLFVAGNAEEFRFLGK
jgi:hypothetical protein